MRYETDKERIKELQELRVREVATLCDVNRNTVRKWILLGLKTIPNSNPIKIKRDDLDRFMETKRTVGRPKTKRSKQ